MVLLIEVMAVYVAIGAVVFFSILAIGHNRIAKGEQERIYRLALLAGSFWPISLTLTVIGITWGLAAEIRMMLRKRN